MTQTEKDQIRDLSQIDTDDFNDFEASFVSGMVERLENDDDRELTEKQSEKLEQIWKRHCGPDDY